MLLISEIFPPRHGGSGRWFFELYRRFPRGNSVIAAGQCERDTEFDSQHADQLTVTRVPLSSSNWGLRSIEGLGFYFRSYRRLKKTALEYGITQVHCGRCLPEGVLGWLMNRLMGLPFLCFVHGEDIQTASASRELGWLIRRVFSRATILVANSKNTAQLLRDDWQVPSEKIAVLHPGMDATLFVPAERDPAFLENMSWANKTVILTVGRLQRRKGQDMMIRAFPAILAAYPQAHYVLIGDGDQRVALQQLTDSLGVSAHVQFLGEIDDALMIQCYQQCTVFALPNRTDGKDIEGFGMVLVEAQACGKPVLAGDSGGTRETLIDGKTGVIADCTSPATLADAIKNLLKNPQNLTHMGTRARAHAAGAFDWPEHANQADKIFHQLEDSGSRVQT